MFSITVVFGPGPTSWRFLYKSLAGAEKYDAHLTDHPTQDLQIADDFGQKAKIKSTQIHAIMLENMEESKQAGIEVSMHDMRTKATIQARIQSDPAIRAAMQQRGPAVLTPVGPNGFGPQ